MLSLNFPIGVIVFPDVTSLIKKQMLPVEGKNATSPFLNSDLALSIPESTEVSKYKILCPNKWAFPSNGKDLIIVPTVRGDRWRLRSHEIFAFPRISKINCFRETEGALNSYFKMIRLYNVLRKFCYLSKSKETQLVDVPKTEEDSDSKVNENAGLTTALDTYRKLFEKKGADPLSEKELEDLQKELTI